MDKIFPAPVEFSAEQLAADPILRYFDYGHLPPVLQTVSREFCRLAETLVHAVPRNAERTVALRKLLEAKDAAVRANVPVQEETFIDRLVAEHNQLKDRLDKLCAFIDSEKSDTLSPWDQKKLAQQQVAMEKYLHILNERLEDNRLMSESKQPLDEPKIIGDDQSETPVPFK